MHDELWAGVELKLQNAEFHLQRMGQSLEPPERTATNVALQASGAILDTGWQRSFYAHLDAFLSATRSVPEIIQCCFGVDEGHPTMRSWFANLPQTERLRRRDFKKQFKTSYDSFRASLSSFRTGSRSFEDLGLQFKLVEVKNLSGQTTRADPPSVRG